MGHAAPLLRLARSGAVALAALMLPVEAGAQALVNAGEIALNVRNGSVKAVDVVEAALDRTREIAGLNAFITLDAVGAGKAAAAIDAAAGAAGPLAGVPFVVKDNIASAGLPTTAGTPALRNYVPAVDAPVLAALRKAGAVLIGKTNMHELAFGITSNNAEFGAVGNAVDPARFAGGSSGGTAAAIAAGVVPFGLGTDTGGSVRIPAALNGIVGFRPTTGRYSGEMIVPISTTRDTAGPMARTVGEVVLIDAILAGEGGEVPLDLSAVRLGLAHPQADNLSAGVKISLDDAIARLKAAGATIVDVDMSKTLADGGAAGFPIALFEARRDLGAYLAANTDLALEDLAAKIASPDVSNIFAGGVLGVGVSEAEYEEALAVRETMIADYAALFQSNALDAIIFPTTPLEAQPIEGSDKTVMLNGEAVPTFPTFIRNTDAGSVIGAPGLSLPMAPTAEGLPTGLEIDGLPGADAALLSLGLAVESVLGD
ncbi:indoleacetamide hydrolase [Acuticoccus sp. MNP-M23]|uniref:indoleacetamide hydrolase n=1 Tax=Acuticoccus sp. MNP-M23 TaxID=3072793 RepID=UPI00281678C2|nr:indoleacetamide hydrolase [Acuticoccus sp. MNP-M23]WMS40778.1 indoleacetamide hydrolase [Acuticoccus sp. MNP-M23]